MTAAQLIPIVIQVSLFVLVFALGLNATLADLVHLARRPGLLVRSILSMNVVMLVLAVAVALLVPLPPPIKIALVALAASPVPPILPGKQVKAGGTESYAIGLLVAASIVAIVMVPAVIELVGAIFGAEYHMPPARVAPVVLVSVIGPLVLGAIVGHFLPAFADRVQRPLSLIAAGLLVLACLPVVYTSASAVWALVGNGVIIFLVLFTLVGIAVGHLLGGPDQNDRTVLALATGTRHPGVAIAIASLNFPGDKVVLAVVLWHLVIGAIVSIPYVRWRKAEHVKAEHEGATGAGRA